MSNRTLSLAPRLLLLSFLMVASPSLAQEMRFVTPAQAPFYDLLPQVAEEKGLWKEGGVPGRWIRFRTGADMYRAVVAGHVDMGATSAPGIIQVNSRLAAPSMVMVADTGGRINYIFWVRTDSPLKGPTDLKGKKVGIIALGTIIHAHGQVVAKSLGIEKEVKFVAFGGVPQRLAAMRAGIIDATIGAYDTTVDLKYKGEVREILDTTDYLPKEWIDRAVFVRPAFAEKNQEMVKRGIKVVLAAADYLQRNPQWISDYLRREYGYSVPPAEAAQRNLVLYPYKEKGKIDRKAVENAINYLAEYNLAPKENMAVDKQFTNAFIE